MKKNAAKLVGAAIAGIDCITVIVAGKVYTIMPPTINRIAGAGYYLSDIGDITSIRDAIAAIKNLDSMCNALSWFICGDESLTDELKEGTMDEVMDALEEAFSLVSVENFLRLSILAKNVQNLTASQR